MQTRQHIVKVEGQRGERERDWKKEAAAVRRRRRSQGRPSLSAVPAGAFEVKVTSWRDREGRFIFINRDHNILTFKKNFYMYRPDKYYGRQVLPLTASWH